MQKTTKNDIISASEISQFMYCSKAWHLQKQGFKPQSPYLKPGTQKHIQLGHTIDTVNLHIKKARQQTAIGVTLLFISIILLITKVIV